MGCHIPSSLPAEEGDVEVLNRCLNTWSRQVVDSNSFPLTWSHPVMFRRRRWSSTTSIAARGIISVRRPSITVHGRRSARGSWGTSRRSVWTRRRIITIISIPRVTVASVTTVLVGVIVSIVVISVRGRRRSTTRASHRRRLPLRRAPGVRHDTKGDLLDRRTLLCQ